MTCNVPKLRCHNGTKGVYKQTGPKNFRVKSLRLYIYIERAKIKCTTPGMVINLESNDDYRDSPVDIIKARDH
jgi:hypothetical protein